MSRASGTRGGDQGGLRAYNRRMILDIIRQHGPMPKAEIARVTGLTAQSASVIVNELLEEGFVRKETKVRGKVGQPTTPIALHPEGAFSIGVKIGRRSTEIALTDFLGTVIANHRSPYDLPRVPAVRTILARELQAAIARVPPGLRDRIVGIGIAAPGELSNWADILGAGEADLSAWDRVDICADIRAMTGLPCTLWNDATAACAAEMLLGEALTFSSALYIYVGTFIGGGIVLDGRLWPGVQGNAGAIGSLPVRVAGSDRSEQLIGRASLYALERRFAAAGTPVGEDIRIAVRRGRDSPAYLGWRAEASEGIACAVASAVAILDFEGVVIDAMLDPEDVAALCADVKAALARFDLRGTSPVRVVPGTVGFAARALGAAILPLVQNFAPDEELLVKRNAAA